MKQKVIDTINKYNLIQKGDSIVIGLSGGADSVCLSLILSEIKDEFDLKLKAVHINHKLRGDESERDMKFCKDFCEKAGIEFKSFEIDVKTQAQKEKQGIEEYARRVRYECFEREADGGKIATAHNLDDVAETLIFNIARGSSVSGLSSIPVKRDSIIRPLLSVSREEIEQFLKEKNQEFVIDSTNLTDEYTRNKIRHNVLPVLKEINPEFLQSVERLTKIAKMQSEFISSLAEKLPDNAEVLKKEHDTVTYEYVSKFLKENGITPDFFHVEKCVQVIKKGGRCQLPKGYVFEIRNNKPTVFIKEQEKIEEFSFSLKDKVKTPYNNYNIRVISYEKFKTNENVYKLLLNNAIDYDKICHSLILRSKKSGDRIMLRTRKVNKLLKSVYNELKIPPHIRHRLAVIEENGKIIWAEKVGVAHSYSPNKNTKQVLIIEGQVDYD